MIYIERLPVSDQVSKRIVLLVRVRQELILRLVELFKRILLQWRQIVSETWMSFVDWICSLDHLL